MPKIPLLLHALVAKRYINFLNRILKENKVLERLYLVNDSCSDTQLAFLTPEQKRFINSLGLNPADKVYKLTTLTLFKPVYQFAGILFKAIFNRKNRAT